ncbi:NAD-dependent epimerase/dehydratase family protein [Intrasporangium chromatireducens]|uniref:NAD-dependent epimerase/dehydratase family protein n=1 Tax=Intrasporangium chromatireducens TaxID=1386088 RepID=UPI0023E41790|nr:NAD(P)-dependent oxidoreductase [Intrasporangium chromatireducens]
MLGAAGAVGRALVPGLALHDLRLFDRRADPAAGIARLDARHLRTLTRRLRGCDAVVDLASDARWDAPWESVYRNNIRLVHCTLEASARAGVKRVVYASSNQVAAGYEREDPWAPVLRGEHDGADPGRLPRLSTEAQVRPCNAYGAGKVFAEAACRWYTETTGVSTVCLRIGTVLWPDRPRNERHFSTWLSHRDLAGHVNAAVLAPPKVRSAVTWAVSANTWRIWDVGDGTDWRYQPCDDAERFR